MTVKQRAGINVTALRVWILACRFMTRVVCRIFISLEILSLDVWLSNSTNEPRRNSVCLSSLRPVHESRPSSPCLFISRDQQIQQKIDFARDLNNNTNINSNSLITSTTPRYPRKLSLDSGISAFKARPRIASLGSSTASSFESCNSASSLFNRLDINEEKLAKTGYMFALREDWSIISKSTRFQTHTHT